METYIDSIKHEIKDFLAEYNYQYSGPTIYYIKNIIIKTISYVRDMLNDTPNVKLLYSVKPNLHKDLLCLLASYVDGFDAASYTELSAIGDLYNKVDYMSISGYAFCASDFISAEKKGIQIDFMSISQILNVADFLSNRNIGLRVNVPCYGGAILNRTDSRFGICFDLESEKIKKLCNDQNLEIRRLHLHSGEKTMTSVISDVNEIEKWLREFHNIEYINLGGGWDYLFEKGLFQEALKLFTDRFPNIRFFIEPGSLLVRNSAILVAKVTDIQHKNESHCYAVLDVSSFNLSSWYKPKLIASMGRNIAPIIYRNVILVGNTCYENDIFDHIVGQKIAQNDTVFLYPVGAYFSTTHRCLHGLPFPSEILI